MSVGNARRSVPLPFGTEQRPFPIGTEQRPFPTPFPNNMLRANQLGLTEMAIPIIVGMSVCIESVLFNVHDLQGGAGL